ncbi:E3 ubiquitin-protein ligase XB3 [Hordeum vulgare]|nr:E3 ubiquitin-protein ligase XB3 [Hordeum vulgare]
MEHSGSDSDQSRSVDWGVIPCGLEEAMAVHIALRRSHEDSARPTVGSVRGDCIASAQRALESSGVGPSRSRRQENLSFPITDSADCESHREWVARRGKRIMAAEARIMEEMMRAEAVDVAARAAEEEEAIRVDKEVGDDEDNSDDEQIRLNPYCVFDRYFRKRDDKGFRKGKGSHG